MKRKRGYIHVYTGDGKGKTTAAIGLALRAAGAGKKVFCGQFVKGRPYNENEFIRKNIPQITIKQYGRGCFIKSEPQKEDIEAAQKGFKEIENIIKNEFYDLIVLDEVNIATYYKLIAVEDLIRLLKSKPESLEIILTGRRADPAILEVADLVTEMKEIKHYYNQGVEAREGIEY
ncbi:MAG: cob(I)yrinic acid a,c-diamide adenosyltransferase [Bacteroidales bacterium]|nr:cob(I)yrinic acid a,c-diamide adenosyltransferase [Bacteroidales bacterium]